MYTNKVFIVFPWYSNYSGVSLNSSHIKGAYDIVIKAMMYRIKYEKLKQAKKEANYQDLNLSNPKTFFTFRNEVLSYVAEADARDYIVNCLVAIRDCDYSKKSVRDSFETLKQYLAPETESSKIIRYALVDEKSFMNFPAIFKYAHDETIDEDSVIIKKIKRVVDLYKDKMPSTEK